MRHLLNVIFFLSFFASFEAACMYEQASNFDEEFFDVTLFRLRSVIVDRSNQSISEGFFQQKTRSYLENNYFNKEEKISEKGLSLLEKIKGFPYNKMLETENNNIKKPLFELCLIYDKILRSEAPIGAKLSASYMMPAVLDSFKSCSALFKNLLAV